MLSCVFAQRGRNVLCLQLSAVLLLSLLVSACKEEPPPPAPVRAVKWIRVEEPSAEQARMISGQVVSSNQSQMNFDVSGLVTVTKAALGDFVKRRQMLAQLDQEPFQLDVRKAEAEVTQAKARKQAATTNYDRIKLLYEANNASKADLDNARADFESWQSQVRAAEAKLNNSRRDLRKSTLRAPFDGWISAKNIDAGEHVAKITVVYVLESTEKSFQVLVDVPEVLIPMVKQGQEVHVHFPANKKAASARVKEIGTRAGAGNAFPVKSDLVGDLPWVRPGMTVEVTFTFAHDAKTEEAAAAGGFMIPMDAVVPVGTKGHEERNFYVFVYDENTSAVRRVEVRGGGIRDNRVNIVEGIKSNDILVAAGAEFLVDGQEVTLYEPQKF